MDNEQEEMQFLGVFGIYKEANKIVFSFRKIFTQITLALILPLSIVFLAHIEVSNVLVAKIMNNEVELDYETKAGAQRYNKLSDRISSEFAYLWLFKAAYLTLFLIFSLLSTAAVVYTVACIYTGREVSFNKVMTVIPKVWKRLMVTFLSIFLAFFAYHVVAVLSTAVAVIAWVVFFGDRLKVLYAFGIVLLVLYFVGLVYLTIVWQLASVVSVLEEVCGFKAMSKSRALIKGKMWTAMVIYFKLNLSSALIQMAFQKLVVHGVSLGMLSRISYGFICLSLLLGLFLFGLVIQTVIYLVCKSYHHENIDKSALSDHLQVYQGEYVPLKSKDVQLEQYYV